MQVIKLKKNILDKLSYFEADSKLENIEDQFITPDDGRLIADLPNISKNGRLILMENSVIWLIKGYAYKVSWDELTLEWLENKNFFTRLFVKGKIQLGSKNPVIDDSKAKYSTLKFTAGIVQYQKGIRIVNATTVVTEAMYNLIKSLKDIINDLKGKGYIQKFIILTDENGKTLKNQVDYYIIRFKITLQTLFLTEDKMFIISNAIGGVASIPVSDIKEIKLLEKTGFLRKDYYIGIITKSGPEFYLRAVSPKAKRKTQELYRVLEAWRS